MYLGAQLSKINIGEVQDCCGMYSENHCMAADRRCWRDWGSREMQQLGKLNIDDSFIGTRIEFIS